MADAKRRIRRPAIPYVVYWCWRDEDSDRPDRTDEVMATTATRAISKVRRTDVAANMVVLEVLRK